MSEIEGPCLDAAAIRGYLEGRRPPATEGHLARCPACRRRLVAVHGDAGAAHGDAGAVQGDAGAAELHEAPRWLRDRAVAAGPGRRLRAMPALGALAASVIAAVALTAILRVGERGDAGDVVRGAGTTAGPELESPAPDARLGDELLFSWRPVPGCDAYVLAVLDETGDVALRREVHGTEVVIRPDGAGLRAGVRYRWLVTALPREAPPRDSELRPFTLASMP